MTEQPKEYITTGDEIDEIEKRFNDLIEKGTIPWEEDCLNTLDNIRSHPVSIPPEGAAPDYEHCGNMSSDGEHDCNYRGGHCNFAHTRHCKDFIPCTCEYCDGTVHDAAIRQEAIAEHDWLLRQNRDNLLCFYENPEELKKFKDEIAQTALNEQTTRVGKKLIWGKCVPNGDCGRCILCDNAGGCLAESSVQVQKAAQAAREEVLEELDGMLMDEKLEANRLGDYRTAIAYTKLEAKIESLRQSKQKKEVPK